MTPHWSAVRLGTAASLAVWAALFWFIIFSDRLPFYLAARTEWLAPLGALTLTAAVIGRLFTARTPQPQPVDRKQVRNFALLVLPALAILLFPPATLGSFAVSRRAPSSSAAYASSASYDLNEANLSFVDIFALRYNDDLELLEKRAGTSSSFTGFVSVDPDDAASEFQLNRFMVSCCPGDAVNVSVRVVGATPGQFEPDDWVRVTGAIYPVGPQVVVDASEIVKVPRPKRPYLGRS